MNLLGRREPSRYGLESLENLVPEWKKLGKSVNLEVDHLQTNCETRFVEMIHTTDAQFLIINAAAWTHSSIAIRDALLGINKPFIEVHISNIYAREAFRHHSYLSDIAVGVISGLGVDSYKLALHAVKNYVTKQ